MAAAHYRVGVVADIAEAMPLGALQATHPVNLSSPGVRRQEIPQAIFADPEEGRALETIYLPSLHARVEVTVAGSSGIFGWAMHVV